MLRLLFFLLAASFPTTPQALGATAATPARLRIMIDPGHGGIDTGAAHGDLREADITLKVALALKRLLRDDGRFDVLLTRDSDRSLSLEDRIKKSNDSRVDLFLSIHANSSPDPRAHGVEFYFQNQLPPDEEALFLAANENKTEKSGDAPDTADLKKESDVTSIVHDLKRQTRVQNSFHLSKILAGAWKSGDRQSSHAVRQAPFRVVSKNESVSVLVEVGFVTNPVEGPSLALKESQERMADHLYRGLLQYIESPSSAGRP